MHNKSNGRKYKYRVLGNYPQFSIFYIISYFIYSIFYSIQTKQIYQYFQEIWYLNLLGFYCVSIFILFFQYLISFGFLLLIRLLAIQTCLPMRENHPRTIIELNRVNLIFLFVKGGIALRATNYPLLQELLPQHPTSIWYQSQSQPCLLFSFHILKSTYANLVQFSHRKILNPLN